MRLGWSRHLGRDCLQIAGWSSAELAEAGRVQPPGLSSWLSVVPAGLLARQADNYPSIAGEVIASDEGLCFIPRHPFVPGLEYAVLVHRSTDATVSPVPLFIRRPAGAGEPVGHIVAIHPTIDELPRNHLRFYVHFSEPMSEGFAARSIQLRRADTDEAIADALLLFGAELWDRERRRLTLLLDPGRIKRGLVPNAEAGYALTEGVPVALSVDAGLPDALGRPLRAGTRREYRIGPDVRTRVNPAQWTLTPPPAGSCAPVVITLDRALDHALLGRCLHLIDARSEPVPGQASLESDDTGWTFRPAQPWRREAYRIVVDAQLEDLAGNSVARVFDRDLDAAQDAPAGDGPVTMGFTCR